jgi:hypothetical protein
VHTRILIALETDADAAPELVIFHADAGNLANRAIDLWGTAGKAALLHVGHAIKLITPQLDGGGIAMLDRTLSFKARPGRADNAHPAMHGGALDEAGDASGGLVMPRRNAAKLLQKAHHTLDAIAAGIAASVRRSALLAV